MSIKFMIVSIATVAVIFTGCASKDVSSAQTATSNGNSVANGAGNGSSTTATIGSNTSSTMANGTAGSSTMATAQAVESEQGKLKAILFDFDKFNIKADMISVAEENAKVIEDKTVVSAKVKLEGNADERGTDEYNYALALKRAEALKTAYLAKGAVASRITTVSLGEGNPVCKESNEECWTKNRRVDTKLEK